MCGITGAIWTDPNRAIDGPTLRKMTDVIRHRGPDDEGSYTSDFSLRPPYEPMPGVALGFRRLSIIDLEGGHQPMSNEDGTVWVVFNGEIYNYQALRRRLDGAGHSFRTTSDTETIVHLYEDEGLEFVQHLNGMFAIAIWDSRHRRLVMARDRIGQKPLVYRHEPGRLLFASELKSLLQVNDVPRDIDAGAIDDYLTYQYIPHPKTIFSGIRKLPPGHLAVYQDGELDVRPYWQPDLNHEQTIGATAASARLVELMTSSVEMRMRSDVPLGAFLSGGVDSSLIVALMQQRSSQPIKTFTIGFPIAAYDETSYARQVARHIGTDHEELQVTPDAISILPKLVWNYDEPFADSSAIPTWYVSEVTRRHVTVALSGDGGDELFAGYPRYKAVWLANQLDQLGPIRTFLKAPFWQKIPGSRQKSLVRRFKRFSEFLGKTPQRRYLEWIAIYNESRRAAIYRDDFVERLPNSDPFDFLGQAWARAGSRDVVIGASLADLTTYLPCDLMTKVDIASMAHSLEVRQPFLDYRVVEFAASLPLSLKFTRGTGKLLLRRAFGHLLPRAIWNRKKMGFGVPLENWFRQELRELTHDTLLSDSTRIQEWFRRDAIEKLVAEHESKQFDHAYRLWSLLVLELWLREWAI